MRRGRGAFAMCGVPRFGRTTSRGARSIALGAAPLGHVQVEAGLCHRRIAAGSLSARDGRLDVRLPDFTVIIHTCRCRGGLVVVMRCGPGIGSRSADQTCWEQTRHLTLKAPTTNIRLNFRAWSSPNRGRKQRLFPCWGILKGCVDFMGCGDPMGCGNMGYGDSMGRGGPHGRRRSHLMR